MVEYKYLMAWDMMMHSDDFWKQRMQRLAKEENAPKNAIYRDVNGKWHTFDDVTAEDTKKYINALVKQIG